MEAAMAVEVILRNDALTNSNCRIKTVIGDDDSSAIAALRRQSPYTIEKWSDFNHAKKTFNSKLYEIKLAANLRDYFSRLFSIAVTQNKGEEIKVKIALQSMIPHAFGNHEICNDYCKTAEDGTHTYKYFKDGLCLSDLNLKEKLEKIIQPFINNSPQIAPCASSQSNESFNNIVCSKHPKSAFYGGSESHCFRVAFAVCQKNLGYEFITTLYRNLNLSPGKYTQQYRKRKQCKFKNAAARKETIPAKKRRLTLKKERASKNVSLNNREGISYKSGSGFLNTSDLIDQVLLPDHVNYEDCYLVIFDTETTGLRLCDEIIEIAAICGTNKFDIYIMPTVPMSAEASEITGITICNNTMYVNDEEVQSFSARDAFLQFLYFLKSLNNTTILAAHNCFRFDAPRLIKLAESLQLLQELRMFVKGFCDSLPLFKSLLPERLKSKPKKSFKQCDLAMEYLDIKDITVSHNAFNDVVMLEKLIVKLCHDFAIIVNHTQCFDDIINKKSRNEIVRKYTNSLDTIEISNHMKTKIAKAGVNFATLKETCKIGGYDALEMLFGENIGNKPRITNNKKIINSVFEQISILLQT